LGDHPAVGDIRGRGLFLGVELVADRASKAPFDPAAKVNAKLKQAAFDAGLMTYPMGGTIDGRRGDHVLLAPPYTIDASHVDAIVGGLRGALAGGGAGGGGAGGGARPPRTSRRRPGVGVQAGRRATMKTRKSRRVLP
nr:hypothetical protein [Burkholderiaceae bacterium]